MILLGDENGTTAARIADAIAERIINGALQPDAALRQDHFAREFNSSHVPVREAFRQLEARHLVVSLPRRGVRVAPLDANSVEGDRRDARGARSGRVAKRRAKADVGPFRTDRDSAD